MRINQIRDKKIPTAFTVGIKNYEKIILSHPIPDNSWIRITTTT
jgi:hypothetical protein